MILMNNSFFSAEVDGPVFFYFTFLDGFILDFIVVDLIFEK